MAELPVKKEWLDMIRSGQITPDLMGMCLFSANRHAKIEREREYLMRADGDTGAANQYKEKKREFYSLKYKLLRPLQPKAIHIVRHITPETVIDDETGGMIAQYYITTRRYLYYHIGDYGCHTPVREGEDGKYIYLKRVDVGNLFPRQEYDEKGMPLLPVPFINEVARQIGTKRFKITASPKMGQENTLK